MNILKNKNRFNNSFYVIIIAVTFNLCLSVSDKSEMKDRITESYRVIYSFQKNFIVFQLFKAGEKYSHDGKLQESKIIEGPIKSEDFSIITQYGPLSISSKTSYSVDFENGEARIPMERLYLHKTDPKINEFIVTDIQNAKIISTGKIDASSFLNNKANKKFISRYHPPYEIPHEKTISEEVNEIENERQQEEIKRKEAIREFCDKFFITMVYKMNVKTTEDCQFACLALFKEPSLELNNCKSNCITCQSVY